MSLAYLAIDIWSQGRKTYEKKHEQRQKSAKWGGIGEGFSISIINSVGHCDSEQLPISEQFCSRVYKEIPLLSGTPVGMIFFLYFLGTCPRVRILVSLVPHVSFPQNHPLKWPERGFILHISSGKLCRASEPPSLAGEDKATEKLARPVLSTLLTVTPAEQPALTTAVKAEACPHTQPVTPSGALVFS